MSFLLPTAITSRLSAGFGGPDSSSKGNSSSNTVETRASSSVKESEPLARPATLAWLALYRILQQPHRQSSLDTAKDKGGADVVGNPEKGDSTAQEDVGPSNEDKEEGDKSDLDILFYSSKELAVTSAQIRRQIGLLRGAADFCASMLPETDASGTDQDGVYTVHSQQHRNVVMKLEEEIWLAVSIEVPRWTKSTVPKVRYAYDEEWRPDSWMVKSLKSAWETWSMLNGKASKQLADGREGRQRLERSLERYFSVWASRWDVAGRAFSSAKESKTKPLVASEALESFLSIDRELQKTDGREEAVICTCARERIGRRVKSVKESPAQTKETVETLCEMMLFRTGKMVLHEAAKSEVKASNRTISLLYNHIRSTYEPIFAEQASRLRNTIRQRRRLEASSKGSGTGRSSLQPIDKASHRLSWLSLWSSPEDTSVDSKAESVISDARNPASNAQEETRGGPKETQKPISPTRSFPSISVTSSAWFGSAAPAPKAAQKEAATEVEGGEGGKGEADEPTEVEDPVPPFEELSLRGWAAGEGQEEGSSVKVRFLVVSELEVFPP
jgi:First Longin domain of INTU, CCZ1 and HPS4